MARKYSHLGSLHSNHKFMGQAPRTSRQAFGVDLQPSQADKHDALVFWTCVVGAIVLLVLWV
jgi:hypothetical protein